MLSMIDEFDKKKDIHVVDNNGDKRQEWKKKRITPGIKWGHCFYFLWFVSGRAAISTVICTKYLGPDTWSASVNSTNGGKHQAWQCLTQNTGLRKQRTARRVVFPRNDVWQISAEIPYWWRFTTQIRVVLLIGRASRKVWFDQSGALPRSG